MDLKVNRNFAFDGQGGIPNPDPPEENDDDLGVDELEKLLNEPSPENEAEQSGEIEEKVSEPAPFDGQAEKPKEPDVREQYKRLQGGFTKVSQENAELRNRLNRLEQRSADPYDPKADLEQFVQNPQKYTADMVAKNLQDLKVELWKTKNPDWESHKERMAEVYANNPVIQSLGIEGIEIGYKLAKAQKALEEQSKRINNAKTEAVKTEQSKMSATLEGGSVSRTPQGLTPESVMTMPMEELEKQMEKAVGVYNPPLKLSSRKY